MNKLYLQKESWSSWILCLIYHKSDQFLNGLIFFLFTLFKKYSQFDILGM